MICSLCNRDEKYYEDVMQYYKDQLQAYINAIDKEILEIKQTTLSEMNISSDLMFSVQNIRNEIKVMSINSVINDSKSFIALESRLEPLVPYYIKYVSSQISRFPTLKKGKNPINVNDIIGIYLNEPYDFRYENIVQDYYTRKKNTENTLNNIIQSIEFHIFSPGMNILSPNQLIQRRHLSSEIGRPNIRGIVHQKLGSINDYINIKEIEYKLSLILCPTCYEFYIQCSSGSMKVLKEKHELEDD